MKLQYVEIAGFRGFRDKVRFDLPSGFAVLTGRNGAGKSTVLDAIDFALTGTINKFRVRDARDGGLDEHIWWVGAGKAVKHYVSVGFIDDNAEPFEVTRTREQGGSPAPEEIVARLSKPFANVSLVDLLQTTLIRDELISALSLDLPEQARFTAVRTAIAGITGPDYSARTTAIFNAAKMAKERQDQRVANVRGELGRALEALTETRSIVERSSSNVSDALKVLDSIGVSFPPALKERTEAVRNFIATRKTALQEIETALQRAKALLPELQHFRSPDAATDVEAAQAALAKASSEKQLSDQLLLQAAQLDATERQNDQYAAHLAALLEHGSALGLQDGCCPLCKAPRTADEFSAALSAIGQLLTVRGQKLSATTATLARTRSAAAAADGALIGAQNRVAEVNSRRSAMEREIAFVRETYERHGFSGPPGDPASAQSLILGDQEKLAQLEHALFILEASSAVDRVRTQEARIATLREQLEREVAKLTETEKALEAARQIETAAKTVANEILTEQFDTVMPLLKELYRRLRPHAEWTEIGVDFGGRVRASLNFVVGDGHNPQFLFSSGQRRAAGLAFLLSIHLSRPWCHWRSLLLDDPVQHVDDYRALNLVEILAAIRKANRQVIVAVEDPALADLVCRRLRSSSGDIGRRFDLQLSKGGTAEIVTQQDVYPMPHEVLRAAKIS
ncbi:MAG: AAA family ATPase [Candidatus Binatus sp.]|uniref:AAA family ATPase n=1 Tax=Candidatus Binatus sp. TaxID=2811406 RepID=UPI002727EB21|nr:AAA family ATPase [Candidatus Binatus sp.]MDO8431316.1 AAA family ATPase [Candidatus Binatus sp.]